MQNKAFTLIELLVVVLIIGILAAIAVPQYQKAVLKADLHRGIALTESLYQAQQVYYLQHGNFAADIDNLDISIPKDASCTKTTNAYDCDYGRIYFNKVSVQFQNKPSKEEFKGKKIAYTHYFAEQDISSINTTFEKDKRYCFASPNNKIAQDVCKEIGGEYISESGSWIYYKLD